MQQIEDSFHDLESLINKLIKQQDFFKVEIKRLNLEIEFLQKKNIDLITKNAILVEENKKIKVVSAISGNYEYKKLMKLKINKLIKELDSCIIKIKNS